MKGIKSTALLLMVLVFIAINAIFFIWVDPSKCGAAEWISYGCMCLAFLFACISIMAYNGKGNEVYSLTVVYIPLRYFYVQTILSCAAVIGALMVRGMPKAVADASFFVHNYVTILLTVYIIVLLVFVVRFIIHSKANQATEASLREQYEDHSYVRDVAPILSSYLAMVSDPTAKKAVKNLYESVRFSANKTSELGRRNRQEVADGVDELTRLIEAQNWQAAAALATRLNIKAKQM